jgi:hypothetical protein
MHPGRLWSDQYCRKAYYAAMGTGEGESCEYLLRRPWFVHQRRKQGYADLSGEIVIPPTFDYAGDFHSGVARVGLKDKYFFISWKGERITPEFEGAFDFSEDLAAVIVGQQVGYIARNGTFAIPPTYSGTSGI